MRRLPVLLFAACGLAACMQQLARPALESAAPESQSALLAPLPRHEDLLAQLKTWTHVLPPRPAGNAVASVSNAEAVIPPQCYTRTEGTHNPCYVCHQNQRPGRENRMNDARLQLAYSFSETGLTNRWFNLFEDRRARISAIGDEEILAWIAADNFSELAPRLRAAAFRGHVPELRGLADGAAAFDERGFARDGSGWVAFNYKPFPSTFWPTNGSTDDVMIRLPERFRTDAQGKPSRDAYQANLSALEATIKGFDAIDAPPIDERALAEDVDGDGALAIARRVSVGARYFGGANESVPLRHLYPRGTEFLHTVRYVGVAPDGGIANARRMKEVRYMVKADAFSARDLGHFYDEEYQEKYEGTLPEYPDRGHAGLYNKMGWLIQGFIEGADGRLRFNTYEETMFCMGCHNTVGSTIDKTFSFARKVDGAAGWKYIDLRGMPDAPSAGESEGEILTYLARVGGGAEFRNNPEMAARWYHADGSLDRERVRAARDVYELIAPSRERALLLNKAYRVIVEDQDYVYGRDAVAEPPRNVYDVVDPETAPTLGEEQFAEYDIRLDWARAQGAELARRAH